MAVIRLAPNKAIVGAKITSQVLQCTPPKDTMSHCKDTLPTQTPLEGPGDKDVGEVETGPLNTSTEPGRLTLKICTSIMQQICRRKREIVSISGFDYANRTLVVDTL